MLVDYHIHTFRCGHAVGTVDEYVAEARKKGLRELGFADHLPLYWLPEDRRNPELAMSWPELKTYIHEVQQVRRANPDLSIKLGLEADYVPGYEPELKKILQELPLDYVLGSVHFLGDWAFDDPAGVGEYQKHDLDELYQRYFKMVQRGAASGLFDIMAHPDLIKKFGFKPGGSLKELYRETVKVFKEAGVCVDVNAAGWRYPCNELYPAPDFLKMCYQLGVPVTLGSDAHKPEQVGLGLNRAAALLKEIGFRQVAVFKGRKQTLVDL
ncbi:histidinol-phosphatase [Desulforamulus ruminis]|uniref:Histidinol-phosphatase n=1 Tax=Desulforamulus ruminis (strain ATCC 23193 / DSM 2154 / NCIMB 8452 / DL) TaxID=696281 RepID=F6DKE5_DESRL|nr:histidinol-phosphatase [Desulforamulus ruminis]AEG61562.1 histidinol phosphate phosphatase HisJ family [Desulforamulus ruminis DSM 2154]